MIQDDNIADSASTLYHAINHAHYIPRGYAALAQKILNTADSRRVFWRPFFPRWLSTIWWRISFGCFSGGLESITSTLGETIRESCGSPPARATSGLDGCAISIESRPTSRTQTKIRPTWSF